MDDHRELPSPLRRAPERESKTGEGERCSILVGRVCARPRPNANGMGGHRPPLQQARPPSCETFPAAKAPFTEEAAEREQEHPRRMPQRAGPGFGDGRAFRRQLICESSEFVGVQRFATRFARDRFEQGPISHQGSKLRVGKIRRPTSRCSSGGRTGFIGNRGIHTESSAIAYNVRALKNTRLGQRGLGGEGYRLRGTERLHLDRDRRVFERLKLCVANASLQANVLSIRLRLSANRSEESR